MQQRQNHRYAQAAFVRFKEIQPKTPTTVAAAAAAAHTAYTEKSLGRRDMQRQKGGTPKNPCDPPRCTNMHELDSRMPYEANAGQRFKNERYLHAPSDKPTSGQGLSPSTSDSCPGLTPEGSWPLYTQPPYAGSKIVHSPGNPAIQWHPSERESSTSLSNTHGGNGNWSATPHYTSQTPMPATAKGFGRTASSAAQSHQSFNTAIHKQPTIRPNDCEIETRHPRDANDRYHQPAHKGAKGTEAPNPSLFPLEPPEWLGNPSIENYSPIFTNDIWYDGPLEFSFQYQHPTAYMGADAVAVGLFSTQSSSVAPLSAGSTANFAWHSSENSYQHSPGSSFSAPLSGPVTPDATVEPAKLKSALPFSEPRPHPDNTNADPAHESSSPDKNGVGHSQGKEGVPEIKSQSIAARLSPKERPQRRGGRSSAERSEAKDVFLVQCKLSGMSYKEIKAKGRFPEAESTLRGRYRTLTKRKELRVRKPGWQENDVSFFFFFFFLPFDRYHHPFRRYSNRHDLYI